MRISDWSSDVCSSDLKLSNSTRYGKTDLIFKSHNVIGRVTHPWCPALGLLQAVISHLISSAREFTIEASGMRGFVINSSAHILCHSIWIPFKQLAQGPVMGAKHKISPVAQKIPNRQKER